MARGLNKVLLIGNLGMDPEIKHVQSGAMIASFTMATTQSRKTRDGSYENQTEWHKIVAFGKVAEIAKDYLRKGSRVFLEGRLRTSSWEDQNGGKKSSTEILADTFIMLEVRNAGDECPSGNQGGRGAKPRPYHEIPDDNLPF